MHYIQIMNAGIFFFSDNSMLTFVGEKDCDYMYKQNKRLCWSNENGF